MDDAEVNLFIAKLGELTAEERKAVFDRIFGCFCSHCGDEHEDTRIPGTNLGRLAICQCSNDE